MVPSCCRCGLALKRNERIACPLCLVVSGIDPVEYYRQTRSADAVSQSTEVQYRMVDALSTKVKQ